MPVYAASSSFSDPVIYTTASAINFNTTVNKYEEYSQKIDKHVDQLEEDIDFFNRKREEMECTITSLINRINELEKNTDDLKTYISWLEHRVDEWEERK